MQGGALLTLMSIHMSKGLRFAYPGPRFIYREIFYLHTSVIEK